MLKSNVRFGSAQLLLVLIAIIAGYLLRHEPLFSMIPMALGWGVVVAFIANLLFSLSSKCRPYFWPTCKFCVAVFVLCAAFIITIGHFYQRDLSNAKNYVQMIKPRLEEIRRSTGHYPNTLTEAGILPSPPTGLSYSKNTESDGENFQIIYFGSIYSSWSGQWFDDD